MLRESLPFHLLPLYFLPAFHHLKRKHLLLLVNLRGLVQFICACNVKFLLIVFYYVLVAGSVISSFFFFHTKTLLLEECNCFITSYIEYGVIQWLLFRLAQLRHFPSSHYFLFLPAAIIPCDCVFMFGFWYLKWENRVNSHFSCLVGKYSKNLVNNFCTCAAQFSHLVTFSNQLNLLYALKFLPPRIITT